MSGCRKLSRTTIIIINNDIKVCIPTRNGDNHCKYRFVRFLVTRSSLVPNSDGDYLFIRTDIEKKTHARDNARNNSMYDTAVITHREM